MNNTTVRINKALSRLGVCSRRKADELISAGRISINGTVVSDLGRKIDLEKDILALDGAAIRPKDQVSACLTYVMLHKPIEVVSTASDPENRKTVVACLPESLRKTRLFPVGRLDYFSEGLLLLTNDGELTHRLTHPRYHLPKEYEVSLREVPSKAHLDIMKRGMTLKDGVKLAPVEAAMSTTTPTVLLLTLTQGINRQVRRMCKDFGLTILKLRRVKVGSLHLGTLAYGESRELTSNEVEALRSLVNL